MTDEDVIRLVGLAEVGNHGVLADERREGQPFSVDLTLYVSTAEAARTDELSHTIDYGALAQAVTDVIAGPPVNLIETLAARIADVALSYGVARVDVVVHKPQAPVGVPFTDVEVRITRTEPTGAYTGVAGPGLTPEELAAGPVEPPVVAGAVVPGVPVTADGPAPVAQPEPEASAYDYSEGVPSTAEPGTGDLLRTAPTAPSEVVLALGGNIGDVRETLRAAVQALDEVEEMTILDVSPLARTAAVTTPDGVGQPDYLNAVVIATTMLSPLDLLGLAHSIEEQFGRVRQGKWSERTLDIDLITYDGVSSDDPELTLPHPLAKERAFVLVPWSHADPEAFLPGVGGGAVAELAEQAPDRDGVRWLALDWLDTTTTGALNEAPSRSASAAVPVEEPVDEPAAEQVEPESVDEAGDEQEPWAATPEPDVVEAPEPGVSVFESAVSFAPPAAPEATPPSRRALRDAEPAEPLEQAEPVEEAEPNEPDGSVDVGGPAVSDWLASQPTGTVDSVAAPSAPAPVQPIEAIPSAEPASAPPAPPAVSPQPDEPAEEQPEPIPWLAEAEDTSDRPAPAPQWVRVRRDDQAE